MGGAWITRTTGEEIYVVLNDDQGEEGAPGRLVNRGFAAKGTWLIRF